MSIDLSSVRMIFFDAAGTLFHVRGSVGEIYSRVARQYGVDTEAAEIEKEFVKAFHLRSAKGIAVEQGEETSQAEKRWWLDVVRQVFASRMPEPVLQAYFEEVFEVFRDAQSYELYPETESLLRQSRGRGYRLGILSNFDSRLHDVLRGLGIGPYFETVILSWDAGAAKPDARIFRHALQVAEIPAACALHVGDSLTEDFEGATGAGMRALLLDRRGAWSALKTLPRIMDLREICEVLYPASVRHQR